MSQIKVAINGFGRIGRTLLRLLVKNKEFRVVAINDLSELRVASHLFKYDSIHGKFNGEVSNDGENLIVDGCRIPFFNQADINKIDWNPYSPDFVVEASGKFKSKELLMNHINNGAKKVILSVPPSDDSIKTVVLGINQHIVNSNDLIISNASCTTNNAAPMISIIDDLYKIQTAYITTIHSYTTDQKLHDVAHSDLRRARAAAQSIVPTTTGAAKAVTKIFPHLDTHVGGCGIRVPVPDGSLTDITFNVEKQANIEEINEIFRSRANGDLKGILEYIDDPIVSTDVIGNTHSCVFDSELTSVIDGHFVKVVGWYDNEMGYSSRLADLIEYVYKLVK
jgi:glyceraldehyde 3-phosphate dehydrogenase